jgi:hypothetical protein
MAYKMHTRVLVVKTGGKRLFERLRRRWEDNINTNLKQRGCEYRLDSSGSG